ncbi:uncharacterized protein LOC131150893 [Malania oleifera]|uniref:uncharacterized protein LOC131150893 n=1 Tax=Malania oleifera TaxID=397392 RepID=UPI0025AE388D|nr:uncharacterized protein LOC131150893 [Malania oleifera]
MSLIAGSYEKFVWGFNLSLTQLFSYPSHLSSIKTVAVGGPVAASAGGDETIKLYDLPSSTEIATITPLESSATALSFYTPPSLSFPLNLISASEDGGVSIYDANPFVLLKTVSAHKKAVNDLSVHPSGKLALTVGRDSCLAIVNLVRGRRSFYCRLGKEATHVNFNSEGDKFFMVAEDKLSVHESEDARLVFELECQKRVLCATPGSSGLLFTGGEERNITAWDTISGKVAYCIEGAHSARVKGIVVHTRNDGALAGDDPYKVSSASSDGVIRVWDVRMAVKEKPNPLAEANTKSRLTCLAGSSLKSFRRKKVGKNVPKEEQSGRMESS